MNKKGSMVVWEELIKSVPAVMIIFLLLFAGVKIWNATHPDQYSTEEKDLKRIIAEIKDLNKDEEITVPVFSTGYTVKAGSKSGLGATVSGCNLDYCLCFEKDSKTICEAFNLRGYGNDCKAQEIMNENIEIKGSITISRKSQCKVTFSN